MRPRVMYSRVGVEAGLDTLDEARAATAAVLHALRDRLTPREAEHAAAQLPTELKAMWRTAATPPWPSMKMHKQDFLERVKSEGGLRDLPTTERAVDAVFAALKEQLSDGESDDILAQLPRDLKRMWVRA